MSFETIMDEVRTERSRQDARFGEQNHADGTSTRFKGLADSARNATARAADSGEPSWFLVGKETFWKAMAQSDRVVLRRELVKLVAVGVAWIESIDRNAA